MKNGQKTPKKLEFRLKNKENRQKACLKTVFWALIGTNRDESAFLGRRAGRRVLVSKSGLSRRERDGWQVCCSPCKDEAWRGVAHGGRLHLQRHLQHLSAYIQEDGPPHRAREGWPRC